jgi:transcriptional regulator
MQYNLTYVEKWINTDSFAKKLLNKSYFTKKQLKDYVTYAWNRDNGSSVTYEQIAKIRNVTKQGVGENIKLARDNIDRAIATLLLSVYTNIIPIETIEFFIEILDAMRVAKESEDEFEFRLLRKKMMKLLSENNSGSFLTKEDED